MTLPAQQIRNSIERVVDSIEQERNEPCRKATDAGVPCFPVSTESRGPVVSVRDALRVPGTRGAPASEPVPKASGITVDPTCLVKSLIKAVKGKNDVYFLYRMRDAQGERVELQDRRLDATTYQGALELLGEFHGECEALAAFRRAAPPPVPISR